MCEIIIILKFEHVFKFSDLVPETGWSLTTRFPTKKSENLFKSIGIIEYSMNRTWRIQNPSWNPLAKCSKLKSVFKIIS